MAGAYHRTRQAQRDLAELSNWLGQQSPALAIRFLNAAKATFELLAAQPGLGGLCHFPNAPVAGLRVWKVKGFPNPLIFYRTMSTMNGGIQIVRVLHAARDVGQAFEES